jgi:hypothetical protein
VCLWSGLIAVVAVTVAVSSPGHPTACGDFHRAAIRITRRVGPQEPQARRVWPSDASGEVELVGVEYTMGAVACVFS